MNTNPLRTLALAAVVAWQGAGDSQAQQLPPNTNIRPAAGSGLEQFQAGGQQALVPIAYRQPGNGAPMAPQVAAPPEVMPSYPAPSSPAPSYPAAGNAAAYGGVQYDGMVYAGAGGYGGGANMQPYFVQTPPGSYINQVDDSQYFDPNQPDENGVVSGGGEGYFGAIYPHGQCYGYTRAEVFALSRDIKGYVPFTSQGPQGPIVLSTNDLDLEYQAGLRTVAGVPLGDCLMLEASYFGLQQWSSSAAATDPTDLLFSVYSGFGTSGGFVVDGRNVLDFIDGSRRQAIDFHSELHNAELNLMYRIPVHSCKQEAWLLAGARYVKVQEQLQYTTESGPNDPVLLIRTSFTDVQTDNDLVGAQLGGILHHYISRKLRASFDAKAAMMVNFTQTQSFVTTNLFPLGGEQLSDDSLALVTDAGAALTFDVNCWFSITGGYRVMYVDGLALAPQNFNPVLPGSGLRQPFLNDNGSILYHGANLGCEIRW